jgi:hypothetical protein
MTIRGKEVLRMNKIHFSNAHPAVIAKNDR